MSVQLLLSAFVLFERETCMKEQHRRDLFGKASKGMGHATNKEKKATEVWY